MSNFLSTLGLCALAKKLVSGEILYQRLKDVYLLVLATDASDRTKKQIYKKAFFYKIDVIEKYTCNQISQATSLNHRMVIGVTDEGFAKILQNS